MDNKDNNQEFSLEDILREFGSDSPLDPEQALFAQPEEVELPAEETEPVPEPDVPETPPEAGSPLPEEPGEVPAGEAVPGEIPEEATPEDPSEETVPPKAPASGVSGDTQRLDDIRSAVKRSLAKKKPPMTDATMAFVPPAEDPAPLLPEEEPSEGTVPGEHPVEDTAAPEPEEKLPPVIEFRSRLRELKKKLVAGPEKRYYDLTEVGTGRVQIAIFVNMLVVLLCAGSTTLYAMDMVMANRMRLLIFSQALAMMVSVLLGCYVLMDGITDLLKGRFSLNSMLFLTLIACAVDVYFCLRELRVPCCAAFSLEMTMALWNRSLRRQSEISQMDTLRKAVRLDSIAKVPDYYDGQSGILRGEGQVEDFMDNYNLPTGPEKVQNIYALISFALCVGIAVLAGLRHGVSMAFQICATSLLVAVPASFFISQSRPAAILQRRLHMVGTVLCGWQGVKALCGRAAFPLRDQDIFPTGSTKLNGVKFFNDHDPDETIAYATALIRAGGSGLEGVFNQLLKSRNCRIYGVENLRNYPAGGIGGEVCGEPVLLGTLNFLQDMGVEIPEGTMVSQAVYCSIDGQLAAVFAINYNRMKSAAGGLVSLGGYRKIHPVVLCTDFMINESLLRSKFGINTKRFCFPTREVREELAQLRPDPDTTACALTTQAHLASAAYAVTGARALRTASRLGLALHMFGGIVGMLIMAALAYIGSVELLTPVNILLYQLVWMVPGLLVTEWTRAV